MDKNMTIINHLEACAIKAITENEVTYQPGTYTAEHLATCDPSPAWDGKEKQTISITIDGEKMECLWCQVFQRICTFGGGHLEFTFDEVEQTEPTPTTTEASAAASLLGTSPKAAPTSKATVPSASPEVKPKGKRRGGKQKTTTADGTKQTIIGTCIEYSKSVPCTKVVRNAKHLEALPTIYYYYDEQLDYSRLYKLRSEDSDLCMVGAVMGDALADIERIKTIEKYKVIAEEGLQAAIDKGLIKDMPHFKE